MKIAFLVWRANVYYWSLYTDDLFFVLQFSPFSWVLVKADFRKLFFYVNLSWKKVSYKTPVACYVMFSTSQRFSFKESSTLNLCNFFVVNDTVYLSQFWKEIYSFISFNKIIWISVVRCSCFSSLTYVSQCTVE